MACRQSSSSEDESDSDSNNGADGNAFLANGLGTSDTYNIAISPGATIGQFKVGPCLKITNQIAENGDARQLKDLASDIKAYLQNCHKTVEDRLNPLPCMDEIWREDYLKDQYVPLLIYKVKKDKKGQQPLQGLHDLFVGDCRKIFVEGEAGYGKSTLSRKVAFDWASNVSYIRDKFEHVFYVELRSIGSYSIFDHIVSELERDGQGTHELIRKLLKQNETKRNTLFILDGWDELPKKDRCPKLKAFQNSFAASTILVTTQPVASDDGSYREFYDCRFVVEGFSPENVDVFISKIIRSFSQMESDDEYEVDVDNEHCELLVQEIKQFVTGSHYFNKNLETLQQSPLLLCLLCFVFVNRKEEDLILPETISGLYITIMEQLAETYINKTLGRDGDAEKKAELKRQIKIGFISFGKLVLDSLVDDSVTFTPQQIEGCDYSSHIKKILFSRKKASRIAKKRKANDFYQPVQVHKPILEYLAACYICSLKGDDVAFDKPLEKIIHVPPMLYSKSTKNEGQRSSMLVTFVCELLKDEAYKFLGKLLLDGHNYFDQFSDVCYLLQNCTLCDKNLECVMQLRLQKKWDLRWLFGRGFLSGDQRFLRVLHANCEILAKILKHPACFITKYELSHIDLLHMAKSQEDFQLFLAALQQNTSLKSVTFSKHHESACNFASDVILPVYQEVIRAIVKIGNLEKIKVDTDLFIENFSLGFTILKELVTEVEQAKHLKALILMASPLSNEDLCNDFHDKKSRNRQAKKKHAIEKLVTVEHISILRDSLEDNHVFSKLSLPKLSISSSSIKELVELLKSATIRVLRIPEMQQNDNESLPDVIAPLFSLLSPRSCVLEELDIRHLVLDSPQVCCLAKHLKENATLKRLNLAGCLTSIEAARILFQALMLNTTLESLNISSRHIVVVSDEDLELMVQALARCCNNSDDHANNAGSLKCVSLSGWTVEFGTPLSLKLLADAIKKSALSEVCLQHAVCKIPALPGSSSEQLIANAGKFVQQCPTLKMLDLIGIEVQFIPYNEPVSRTDSGFHSMASFEEELQSPSSDDSLQVNFSDNSQISDLLSESDLEHSAAVLSDNADLKIATLSAHDLSPLTNKSMFGQVKVCFYSQDLLEYKHSIKLDLNQQVM